MPLRIVNSDITKMECDVIVNPTDPEFSGGGGTDLAVHRAAGSLLDNECGSLAPLHAGEVAVTGAYGLPCGSIIHTVGPIWTGGGRNEYVLLRSCYLNALFKARELNAASLALPLISAGTFGFPKRMVLKIALEAISDFLGLIGTEPEVYLCVFDREAYELAERSALDRWLDMNSFDNAICASVMADTCAAPPEREEVSFALPAAAARKRPQEHKREKAAKEAPGAAAPDLESWIKHHDDSFAVTLMKLIDKKGMTDVQCYKKANVSKGTFWKINNDANYRPSKPTVLAFAIALELSLTETEQLLRTVGFSLSHSSTFDLIVEFYIRNGNYDVFEINAALYQYDQVCLGC